MQPSRRCVPDRFEQGLSHSCREAVAPCWSGRRAPFSRSTVGFLGHKAGGGLKVRWAEVSDSSVGERSVGQRRPEPPEGRAGRRGGASPVVESGANGELLRAAAKGEGAAKRLRTLVSGPEVAKIFPPPAGPHPRTANLKALRSNLSKIAFWRRNRLLFCVRLSMKACFLRVLRIGQL